MAEKAVLIYDPASPGKPVHIHPANFNPTKGHRQWAYRPTAVPQDWSSVIRELQGIPESLEVASDVPDRNRLLEDHGRLLEETKAQAGALETAKILSIESLVAASTLPSAIGDGLAKKLLAWAKAFPLPEGIAPAPSESAPNDGGAKPVKGAKAKGGQ